MLRRILLLVLSVLVLCSPFLARYVARSTATSVDAALAKPRKVRETVLATGNLIYRDQALLSPELIAKVQAVMVKEGDEVAIRQPVIYLEQESLLETVAQQQAQLAIEVETVRQQQANVSNLEIQLSRLSELTKRGFVSRASYDSAIYGLKSAQALLAGNRLAITRARAVLKQADFQLQRTIIRAPMSGTVVSVTIKPGETAVPSAIGIPGSSLVTIARKDTMMVDLSVDENDVGRLSIGGIAEVVCPTLPDRGIQGRLREIALAPRRVGEVLTANDATGRSYSVKVDVGGKETTGLRQGMSCRAKVYTSDPPPVTAVPVQSILSDQATDDDGIKLPGKMHGQSRSYVFVVNGDRASRRYVQVGKADDEYEQILSGLAANEKVITGPYRALKTLVDGAKIAPTFSK